MAFGGCPAEVDRCQGGEDECLKGGHQRHLEQEERDGHEQGEDTQRGQPQQDDETTGHEKDQQVAGEDVGE